ncbi:MAG: hypothetical protein ACI4TG_08160 [Ruminococcus sp.]
MKNMNPHKLDYNYYYNPMETNCQCRRARIHGNQFLNDGVNSTPQATAVKLAQLGEGDSPQCGEMSA